MNKTDLISGMAENAGITKAAAKKALDSLLVDIEGSLQKGNRVSLVGFGSWSVSKRSAREGRNPQTGKTIQIKAKNVVKFKAGSDLSVVFFNLKMASLSAIFLSLDSLGTLFCPPSFPWDFIYPWNAPFSSGLILSCCNILPSKRSL